MKRAARSGGSELTRRHPVPLSELLSEVILGIEAASARDLGHAQIAALEQVRSLLEPLLFEEVAEQTSGDAMEAPRDVLSRVAELARDGLHRDFFVGSQAPANGFDE
jgi:hypothetical protein